MKSKSKERKIKREIRKGYNNVQERVKTEKCANRVLDRQSKIGTDRNVSEKKAKKLNY